MASGRRPPARDVATLNDHVVVAYEHARLEPSGNRLALAFDSPLDGSLSEPILSPVVRAAADLLTSDRIARVRRCADESCRWLFLDATRSGTRRWCDMQVCGNRNKVRNFRART
jgi:predicted RNA-binding Zn ribbon-like protein